MIKPLPNPEPYPLTPEAKAEIFISDFERELKEGIEEVLLSFKDQIITYDFYKKIQKALNDYIICFFQKRQIRDTSFKVDYRLEDGIFTVEFAQSACKIFVYQISLRLPL